MGISLRFLAVALVILVLNGAVISWLSDQIMEDAFLQEAKHKIHLYLDQIAVQVAQLDPPTDADLAYFRQRINQHPIFGQQIQIKSLYLFDQQGQILAHSQGKRTPKKIQGAYAQVVLAGQASLGERVEWDPKHQEVSADFLLPIQLASGIQAGIEAEVSMTGVMQAIAHFDEPFEIQVWTSILGSSILMFLLLGWLVHRRLTGPVQDIYHVVQALCEGALHTRTQITSQDEIGTLARGVNQLAQSVQDLLAQQEEAYLQTLKALMRTLEAKDPYTAAHSGRVAHYSVKLGRYIGLAEQELNLLRKGALMHDLGKIGIQDQVLNKPAALTAEEYQHMQAHPQMTASIMKPLKRFKAFAEIAAWHHERWDGRGYPDGLTGTEIPLLARIVAIADTWDAMTGDRVYRKGMPAAKALAILESEQDQGQFDPQLIRQFIRLMQAELAS
ncbi:HAMP domain-containing protein [Allopseudospirillum japonicum]|uniref:HAMP domain-containing protein n=1 Tax=Allopseudospirillum japonicum TaxID=64971 RepID=A0A1H6SF92_9GAMM|nr:HD domain-containing phosphohydrolase [Allopseudospirillum japonicum]SEI64604.1 HAMP domain-containing protein [Allopseudospirillum japonicum]